MTISEAIEELRSRKLTMSMCIDIESCRNANNAIDMSIQALEENDKLKAEIEKLIEYIENQKKLYEYRIDLQLKYSDRNHEEIEQLKAELEQSVKLPCKVGDKLFYIQESSSITNNVNHIVEVTVIHTRFDDSKFSFDFIGNVPCSMCMECFDEKGFGDYYGEHEEHRKNGYCTYEYHSRTQENLGIDLFLTKEEAEEHLKGKV